MPPPFSRGLFGGGAMPGAFGAWGGRRTGEGADQPKAARVFSTGRRSGTTGRGTAPSRTALET